MADWYAIDAISESFDRVKEFFKGPGLFKKWIKLAILSFIVTVFGSEGGGGNGNIQMPSDSTGSSGMAPALQEMMNQLAAIPWDFIAVIAFVVIIIIFVLGIICTLIRNAFFFPLLESIESGNVKIFGYVGQFFGLAISLTLFDIAIMVLFLPFSIALIIAGIGLMGMFFSAMGINLQAAFAGSALLSGFFAFASNPAVLVVAGLFGFAGVVLGAIVNFIKKQFSEYLMYTKGMSAWTAFKESARLVKGNIVQSLLVILIKIVLGIVIGILVAIAVIIMLIPLAILALIAIAIVGAVPVLAIPMVLIAIVAILILVLVLSVLLLPIRVFFYYYDLNVLGKFLGAKGGKVIKIAEGAKGKFAAGQK
ncbi:MAG: hypothetical protein ABH854_00060 [Candidatus Diapherotrites archaeon]